MALINKLNAIGDAIREKTGKEDLLTLDQMPDEIRSISGGAGGLNLNFKVEWYVSEDLLPETAEENTIAVISDQDVANWIFSAEEPSAAADGDVWFKTSDTSDRPFNALPATYENSLYVYIQSAKQLAQAEWQDVISIKIFQEGEWRELLSSYLLYGSNQYESVTGGWVVPNGSIGSQGLVMDAPNNPTLYKAYTNNAIDFSRYSELVFEVTRLYNHSSEGYSFLYFSVEDAQGSVLAINGSPTTGTVKLDVSSINTTAYPKICCSYTSYVTIEKILLR